jgi:hypothetical protein
MGLCVGRRLRKPKLIAVRRAGDALILKRHAKSPHHKSQVAVCGSSGDAVAEERNDRGRLRSTTQYRRRREPLLRTCWSSKTREMVAGAPRLMGTAQGSVDSLTCPMARLPRGATQIVQLCPVRSHCHPVWRPRPPVANNGPRSFEASGTVPLWPASCSGVCGGPSTARRRRRYVGVDLGEPAVVGGQIMAPALSAC